MPVRDKQGSDKGPAIADQNRLAYERVAFQGKLDPPRIDIRTVGAIKNVFFPADHAQRAIRFDDAEVAGMKPAIRIQDFARRIRVAEITWGHRRSPDQNLAVLGDAQLDVGERLSQIAGTNFTEPAQRNSSTLGGTIGSEQRNAYQFK